jgi:hypothetical protein
LGASVILFLLYGAANVLAALAVPTTLIHGGAGANTVVLDPDSDAYLVGGKQVINALRHDNPKLDTLLVSSMVSMCSQMMAFAIVAILVTWFAIRRGQTWGLWAVTAAALAQVPYYVAITTMYAAQGAPHRRWARGFLRLALDRACPRSSRDATDAAFTRWLNMVHASFYSRFGRNLLDNYFDKLEKLTDRRA